MPKSYCHACGGAIGQPSKRAMRAAFGAEVHEDEEPVYDDFRDASHFDPHPYFYAEGGSVPEDSELGRKREADLPEYQLPVYRGENAAAKERERQARERDEDEEEKRDRKMAANFSHGGQPKLGSGRRFSHLTHALEGRGDVKDPKALAAVIGREKFGAKKMAALSAAHHAQGGEARPSFSEHMAKRMRVRHSFGGR